MKSLIIVESPTKAKTIQKFLGKNFLIKSSFGHVRDLPKRELGVDVDKNFEVKYVIPVKAKKVVAELKKDAKKVDDVILATDEDREGESISWHIMEALKLKNQKRIVFHEITESAIKEALENPRTIDINLVDAQQARRILDRIVGYKLSPFLWKKVAKGLSAGRVQSVAVRLIVEKEEEIKKFIAQEYWSVEALLKSKSKTGEFPTNLTKKDGKSIDKLEIKNETEAKKILNDLENAEYKIHTIEKKETKRNPMGPFTTSTLQQTAVNKFGYSSKMTMSLAQKLYEQGHITYHRTDSLNLSQLSLNAAQKFIKENFGEQYYNFRKFKAKGNAQEAHEAIRPTFADRTPESLKDTLDSRQLKVYTLIWQRFLACQMTPAIFDATSVEIEAGKYTFSTNGQMLKFDGFLKVYPMKFTEADLPKLEEKEILDLVKIDKLQHFTEPPARYNEASLIKALEKHGIGRPSTYAPIISTIQDRNYVQKNEQKRFAPTEMGTIVNDILVTNFPQVVDIDFTAKMEKELDEIAEGKDTWQKTCKDFYGPFAKNLKEKYEDVPKENLDIKTDKVCPKCSKPMIEKMGRFGRFYACTGFPECKHTESVTSNLEKIDITCPKCKTGKITAKKTKKGKIFYGCDTYPACDFALWDKPVDEFCPKCNSILIETKSKNIYPVKFAEGDVSQDTKQFNRVKCSNKDCDKSHGTY